MCRACSDQDNCCQRGFDKVLSFRPEYFGRWEILNKIAKGKKKKNPENVFLLCHCGLLHVDRWMKVVILSILEQNQQSVEKVKGSEYFLKAWFLFFQLRKVFAGENASHTLRSSRAVNHLLLLMSAMRDIIVSFSREASGVTPICCESTGNHAEHAESCDGLRGEKSKLLDATPSYDLP